MKRLIECGSSLMISVIQPKRVLPLGVSKMVIVMMETAGTASLWRSVKRLPFQDHRCFGLQIPGRRPGNSRATRNRVYL
jgi:hypothetical protein